MSEWLETVFQHDKKESAVQLVWKLKKQKKNLCPARTRRGNVRFYCIDFLPLAVIKLLWTRSALGFTCFLQSMADCVVFEEIMWQVESARFLPFFNSLLFEWMEHKWMSFYDWRKCEWVCGCVCESWQADWHAWQWQVGVVYLLWNGSRQSSARWQLTSATAKTVCVCTWACVLDLRQTETFSDSDLLTFWWKTAPSGIGDTCAVGWTNSLISLSDWKEPQPPSSIQTFILKLLFCI